MLKKAKYIIEEVKKIDVEKCSKCGKLYIKDNESNKCKDCENKSF